MGIGRQATISSEKVLRTAPTNIAIGLFKHLASKIGGQDHIALGGLIERLISILSAASGERTKHTRMLESMSVPVQGTHQP
jgi:hypothetical protein